jgi:hypothetical protein
MEKGSGGRRLALREIAFDVFTEDIDFQVDGVAGDAVGDVGVPVGVGDDGDFGDGRMRRGLPSGYSEAYAVDGEGTLPDDVRGEVSGDMNAEEPGIAVLLEMGDVTEGVNVAEDEVAAEFFARG